MTEGFVILDLMWSGIEAKPKLLMHSDNNGDGMAPTMEHVSCVDFQKVEGNTIASGYINGIEDPTDIEHRFCMKKNVSYCL